MNSLTALNIALWLVVLLEWAVLLALFRHLDQVKALLEVIAVPTEEPNSVSATDLYDLRTGALTPLLPAIGNGAVLLFVSSGCAPCSQLLGELAKLPATVNVIVLWYGDVAPESVPSHIPVFGLRGRSEWLRRLAINATPYAMRVERGGHIVRRVPVATLEDLSGSPLTRSKSPTLAQEARAVIGAA